MKTIPPPESLVRCWVLRAGRNTFLNECDGVFALLLDVAAEMAVEYRVCLFTFYLTNLFYEEALSMPETNAEVAGFLRTQGCSVVVLLEILKAAV